ESEASCEGYREQHKALSNSLKEADEKMKVLTGERDDALKEVEELKAKISELEIRLSSSSGAAVIEEEKKRIDPDGDYSLLNRAGLISKIHEYESSMVEAASLSFKNEVAQLRVLNPELVEEGLDEDKEVRDGQILPPYE
ncbi:hypothetical protein L195_g039377, partial [Trifolium pratense]